MTGITKKTASGALSARSTMLDKIRAAKPAKALAGTAVGAPRERRPRLVFGVDATASREATWQSARRITDRMFESIPGALDVALAVHGGNAVHTLG